MIMICIFLTIAPLMIFAIEINPRDEKAFYNPGNAYWHLGNHTQAIEDLKTAAKLGHGEARNFLKSQGREW
jgi:regulator of sirC expression with transglutaminase-like and TPR domain